LVALVWHEGIVAAEKGGTPARAKKKNLAIFFCVLNKSDDSRILRSRLGARLDGRAEKLAELFGNLVVGRWRFLWDQVLRACLLTGVGWEAELPAGFGVAKCA
jgi:hypothetical protein